MDEIMSGLIRILTVDDHAMFREALAMVLATQPDMKLVAENSAVPGTLAGHHRD
jgi:DNA-binding NarL/FixJ family response regulator